MEDEKINIEINDEEITDDIKDQIKDADQVHIHKTNNDGEEVDVDINKGNKTVFTFFLDVTN